MWVCVRACVLMLEKVGEYQQISNFNNLRASLSRYYSFFATESTTGTTVITVPYYDAFGLGECFGNVCTWRFLSVPVGVVYLIGCFLFGCHLSCIFFLWWSFFHMAAATNPAYDIVFCCCGICRFWGKECFFPLVISL